MWISKLSLFLNNFISLNQFFFICNAHVKISTSILKKKNYYAIICMLKFKIEKYIKGEQSKS